MNPNEPSSKAAIYLSCRDLINADWLSKSDPLVLVKEFNPQMNRWIEFGRTEKIMNELNPNFATSIEIDYYFERVQKIRFEVYDVDQHDDKFVENKGDFLGQHTASLPQLIRSKETTAKLKKMNGDAMSKGTIQIKLREIQTFREQFQFQFSATNLPKHGFIFKNSPYTKLLLQSLSQSNSWQSVYQSKVVNSVNPTFPKFNIKMYKLTLKPGNVEDKIRISICDHKKHSYEYGAAVVTIAELVDSANSKSAKSWKIGSAFIVLNSCSVERVYTFFEYIQDGFQLSFAVGIDFTASNGDPKNPESLHYLGNQGMENDYTCATRMVGEVIQEYDTDKYFPVLGFGAKLPPKYDFVSHDFAVNNNPTNPDCFRVDGILNAYRSFLPYVQLYGPTNFAPIILHISHLARSCPIESKNYFILLILTDGIITDMDQTRDAIVEASCLPISIIIVGVGNADFDEMVILDSDDGLLKSSDRQRTAKRDIVQFVPFNKFRHGNYQTLANEVLEELPDQVTKFYASYGLYPRNVD